MASVCSKLSRVAKKPSEDGEDVDKDSRDTTAPLDGHQTFNRPPEDKDDLFVKQEPEDDAAEPAPGDDHDPTLTAQLISQARLLARERDKHADTART